jgi:hypothetical protein
MSAEGGKWKNGCLLGFGIVALGLLISVIASLVIPAIMPSGPLPHRAEAVSNAKQLGFALFEFREEYGSYPSSATAMEVKRATESPAKMGNTTSNDFFRQLIASGMMDREGPFYVRTLDCKKPDNVMSEEKLLEKGEVGFAYVVSHAACREKLFPLLLAPLVKGKLLCDGQSARKFLNGEKAIVLWSDGSVTIDSFRKDGRIQGPEGKDFFDPSQPYWHGIPPKVAWPE